MASLPARRALLLALGCCLLGSGASAQEFAVTVAPTLQVDDELTLEITQVRESTVHPHRNGKGTTPVQVRVVAVTPEGMWLDWVEGESRFDYGWPVDDPFLLEAVNATTGLQLRLALNANGAYAGLANQADVAARLQGAVQAIADRLAATIPAERRAGFHTFLSQFMSPATLLALTTRTPQAYFSLSGLTLAPGESVTARVMQPGILGVGSIPGTFRVTLESVANETATFTSSTTYDAGAALRASMTPFVPGNLLVPEAPLGGSSAVQIRDEGRFIVDRTLGLMREVVVTRRVTTERGERLERHEIRLVSAPRR